MLAAGADRDGARSRGDAGMKPCDPTEAPADPVAEGVAAILLACSMLARIAERLATERLLRVLRQAPLNGDAQA
jgi:hypothetical protein